MEFKRLTIDKIVSDEFDFPLFVVFATLRGVYDDKKAPIRLMNGIFDILFQFCRAGIRVRGFDKVIDQPEKVSRVA